MTFTFTVKQNPLEISFEAGSVAEGAAILQEEGTALAGIFADMVAEGSGAGSPDSTELATTDGAAPKRRGRGPNKPKVPPTDAPPPPAPAASAPAPLPVPGNPAPPPALPAAPSAAPDLPADGSIPPFLQRGEAAPTVAAPPPPPPPAPAPAPPTSPLAAKVVEHLKARVAGGNDPAGLVAWLAAAKICTKTATFDEALAVLAFTDHAQIAPIAAALGVA